MKKLLIVLLALIVAAVGGYYAFPEKVAGFLISQARGKAGLSKKAIKIGDHNMVYLESKAGQETILLLHGYSANKDNWIRFAAYLKDYHVVIPDLPGHGESSKLVSSQYTLSNQIERLHQFAGELKIAKFHIAGNSMGGWFAGAYAARYPAEVLSVGLVNAAGVQSLQLSEVMRMGQKGENPLLLKDENDLSRLMSLIFVQPPFMPYPIKKWFVREALANQNLNQKIMGDITPDIFSLEKDLPKIAAPALILWGDKDKIIDVSSVPVFEKGLKRYKTVIINDCGHAPMLEKPQETANAYLAFLKSVKN
ncbi:MAG: alpha/beta hydrolase [Deltaproteobacteria bacterium HGW-Deltaproteobacteria-12]|jgi:pimeloyl-ACP methyl ester carboxylesterase|nr:MAG: alpha/beta hydrolase [Deltaproteobacteria bacterium HGW-Deltaproteobacteria-12]